LTDDQHFLLVAKDPNQKMDASKSIKINRREIGNNIWITADNPKVAKCFTETSILPYEYEVLETEKAVGNAMLEELKEAVRAKNGGDLVMLLLGGRGAQAMYRVLGKQAETDEVDEILAHLHVFTQDALAPMRLNNGLSFVRDFERLLGAAFFEKIKSFTPMRTDTEDLEAGLTKYLEKLESLGGIDLFFLGLGPEAEAASHLAYIKPNSGAAYSDVAGIIPISSNILEHHINKFKAGGSHISKEDEAECRAATHILTLGPAAILGAKKVVQSIVDADTAPGKVASFQRVLETEISHDLEERAKQMDENPGLWLRIHPNVRTLVLPNLFAA
jgi:6-phosphogluconolactonase/glucosamine-6-phosphate isomerase/deaminase